ncbi:MAG: zf-HC2 domain-containing protein [Bryobacteraceae bacterium]
MTHEEIQRREIAELYVRGRLDDAERAAFEDHYFACDECFEQTEILQKFVDGVTEAAVSGKLPRPARTQSFGWFRPAFFAACAASLVLAVTTGWFLLVERPRLESAIAHERSETDSLRERVDAERKEVAGLAGRFLGPEPNLPLVMLTADRAAGTNTVTLSTKSSHLALWIEPPPAPASATYLVSVLDASGATVERMDGVIRNSYGALACALPAAKLRQADYRVQLFIHRDARTELVGEYRLDVRK